MSKTKVQQCLDLIKSHHLTNDELSQLSSSVKDMIVYTYELDGVKYTLSKPPPIVETRISETDAFEKLMLPFFNSRTVNHISNARDMINFIELAIRHDVIVFRNIKQAAVEIAINAAKEFRMAVMTKQGRAKIKSYFKDHAFEIELGAKSFIRYVRKREFDKLAELSLTALLLVLKLVVLLS